MQFGFYASFHLNDDVNVPQPPKFRQYLFCFFKTRLNKWESTTTELHFTRSGLYFNDKMVHGEGTFPVQWGSSWWTS